MKAKLTTDSMRKRLATLAHQRVITGKTTDGSRAEYTTLVKTLASRAKIRPGTVRLQARRAAYSRAH